MLLSRLATSAVFAGSDAEIYHFCSTLDAVWSAKVDHELVHVYESGTRKSLRQERLARLWLRFRHPRRTCVTTFYALLATFYQAMPQNAHDYFYAFGVVQVYEMLVT
jgi:hypothetical protein